MHLVLDNTYYITKTVPNFFKFNYFIIWEQYNYLFVW